MFPFSPIMYDNLVTAVTKKFTTEILPQFLNSISFQIMVYALRVTGFFDNQEKKDESTKGESKNTNDETPLLAGDDLLRSMWQACVNIHRKDDDEKEDNSSSSSSDSDTDSDTDTEEEEDKNENSKDADASVEKEKGSSNPSTDAEETSAKPAAEETSAKPAAEETDAAGGKSEESSSDESSSSSSSSDSE